MAAPHSRECDTLWENELNVIALLTDFGTRDTYVAQMRGVIACREPSLCVIDVTHAISPQAVLAGAYALADAVEAFPAGTVFVVVVDPGVGSERRAIAAEIGAWRYVGPDNGLLSVLLVRYALGAVVELSNPAFHRQPRSSTFHGRDIFAPVAAAWATGTPLAAFGSPVTAPLVRIEVAFPLCDADEHHQTVTGVVIDADHFGNLRSNIDRETLGKVALESCKVAIDGTFVGPIANCYADGVPGDVIALFGSNNRLEVAVCHGSAAERFPLARTMTVSIPVDGTEAVI